MGAQICSHRKQRQSCSICRTGSHFCPCGRYRSCCRLCSPEKFCIPHNRLLRQCAQCSTNPRVICECGKLRLTCRIHNTKQFCQHLKSRKRCQLCTPDAEPVASHKRQLCICCKLNVSVDGATDCICRTCLVEWERTRK